MEAFQAKVKQNLYGEDGIIKKDKIAQIINPQNFSRIKSLFDDAIAKGATVAVGGTLEAADRTIHPTLLTDVTPAMQITQEVRDYAAAQGVAESEAVLEQGMQDKAQEFRAQGAEVYRET